MTGDGGSIRHMTDPTEEVAGELVLCPIMTTARAGEAFTIDWWVQEHVAVERVRIWRAPKAPLAGDIYAPKGLITELFRVEGYAIRGARTVYGEAPRASEARFSGVLAPGDRFGLTLRAGELAEGFAAEAPVIVAVSVRRPPPCFRARAAA